MSRLALVLLCALAPAARAGEGLCFTASLPLETTDWVDAVSIPRFDPALGTLTAVHVRVEVSSLSTLAFENPDAAPQAVTVTQTNLLELRRPGGGVLATVTSQTEVTETVAAFDGTIDFDGPSGRSYPDLPEVANGAVTLTAGADLALFTGTGSVALPVLGTGTCVGTCACGLVVVCDNRSAAEVTVAYVYDPAPAIHEADAVPLQPTSWTDVVSVRGFDPSWGELDAVALVLRGRQVGQAGVEHLDSGDAEVTLTAGTALDLALPDGSPGVSLVLSEVLTATVGGFDGTIDFAGPSGWTGQSETEGQVLAVLTDPAAVQQFVGASPVALGIAASAASSATGPGNFVASFQLEAGADVEVIYLFRPCASVTVADALVPAAPGWSGALTLPRFDPALGALRGVLLAVRADVETTAAYESLAMTPSRVDLVAGALVDLQRPGGAPLAQLDGGIALDEHAAAFDGTVDLAGASGATIPGLRATVQRGILLDQPADLAPFVGAGSVTLPASATGVCQIGGPAGPVVTCATLAGVAVDATYVYAPPVGVASCFGVGCPCGNDSPGAGCATSTGAGALLAGSGSARVSCDDLVLDVTGAPAGQSGLFFMGDVAVQNPFFDGFQCALGTTWRFLDSIQATGPAGTASHSGFVAGAGGLIAPGTSWTLQFWFRDAPVSPCGTGANLTNALTVAFVP